MGDAPSRQDLEAAHCWEADNRVPHRPTMTADFADASARDRYLPG